MTRRLTALVLAGVAFVGTTACEFEKVKSPNGNCSQTPGQCGHSS